jgi:2-C-methyl-D-erythritol 4-phosphate cytidylyltransferase
MVFDYSSAHNYAVLLMGGKGLRLQSETPKQYMMVAGQELFLCAAKTLSETRQIDFIIYVVPARYKEKTEKILSKSLLNKKPHVIIEGAEERELSCKNAIWYLKEHRVNPHSLVLIHDADRPNLTSDIISKNIAEATKSQAAVTAIKADDSMALTKEGTIDQYLDRTAVVRLQTPQTFSYALLYSSFLRTENPAAFTDEGSLVAKATGTKATIVNGDPSNYKITNENDLKVFEQSRKKK